MVQSPLLIIIYHYQNITMRLSIRLQNHGKKNHPYWWIVVAPQHKNIFGRFTQHIGFWSPRHNVNIKRQVILNIPRLMYWLGNGAIPTYKIQKFMHMFGIFPKPWKYVKSVEQLAQQAKKQKPYEQMTPKQKSLKDRKRKRQERQQLHYAHYHRYEAYAMRQNKLQQQLMGLQQANDFQNEVIRNILHEKDFQKYDRLAQLSGDSFESKPHLQKLNQIKDKIRKNKSQLAMLQRHYIGSNITQRSKLISSINSLSHRLSQLQRQPSYVHFPEQPTNESEYMTTDYLQKRAKYELITKRFEKNLQQIQQFPKLFEPVTVAELAQKIKQVEEQKPKKSTRTFQNYLEIAENIILQKNRLYSPMTKLDLLAIDPDSTAYRAVCGDPKPQSNIRSESFKYVLNQILNDEVVPPTTRPVHPRPDLKTYIPQQHYDPIDKTRLQIMRMDSLQPQQQVQKYKRKRKQGESVEERQARDLSKRMQRLKLNISE